MTNHREKHPIIVVISGPSGVGKDAIITRMKKRGENFHFTVTATTRAKRPAEQKNKDYIFLSTNEFNEIIRKNGFLEYAQVYGNYYGVPKDQVDRALSKNKDVLIKIDVQGAKTIKNTLRNTLFIFLSPPNFPELERRLKDRMTEDSNSLRKRLATAKNEMKESVWFDHIVINNRDQIDLAVDEITSLLMKARNRLSS
jgi:guanylate kinase